MSFSKTIIYLFTLLMVTQLFANESNKKWITDDFFIEYINSSNYLKNVKNVFSMDCRDQISKKVCLVNYVSGSEMGDMSRTCLDGSIDYSKHFEDLYDHYPKALKKMFCSLDVIFIEKGFFGTGYGGLVEDENGEIVGAKLGVRKSVIDENLNLSLWATWKDQLNFGANPQTYQIDPTLPNVHTMSENSSNDFLYFLVAHEFGHLFDFTNYLNREDCGLSDTWLCPLNKKEWAGFSWETADEVIQEFDFSERNSLCFYWCNDNHIGRERLDSVYHGFISSNFISLYATSNPADDFAETLAYFLMKNNISTSYIINIKEDFSLDIMDRLSSNKLKNKYDYIENFLKRNNIRYP